MSPSGTLSSASSKALACSWTWVRSARETMVGASTLIRHSGFVILVSPLGLMRSAVSTSREKTHQLQRLRLPRNRHREDETNPRNVILLFRNTRLELGELLGLQAVVERPKRRLD